MTKLSDAEISFSLQDALYSPTLQDICGIDIVVMCNRQICVNALAFDLVDN